MGGTSIEVAGESKRFGDDDFNHVEDLKHERKDPWKEEDKRMINEPTSEARLGRILQRGKTTWTSSNLYIQSGELINTWVGEVSPKLLAWINHCVTVGMMWIRFECET